MMMMMMILLIKFICILRNQNEAKYEYLIRKREKIGFDYYKDPKSFTEYSNNMQDVNKILISTMKEISIVFDDMLIADMIINKTRNPMVTELFMEGRKLNILFAFITQSYFTVQKDVSQNSMHCFIMKVFGGLLSK